MKRAPPFRARALCLWRVRASPKVKGCARWRPQAQNPTALTGLGADGPLFVPSAELCHWPICATGRADRVPVSRQLARVELRRLPWHTGCSGRLDAAVHRRFGMVGGPAASFHAAHAFSVAGPAARLRWRGRPSGQWLERQHDPRQQQRWWSRHLHCWLQRHDSVDRHRRHGDCRHGHGCRGDEWEDAARL